MAAAKLNAELYTEAATPEAAALYIHAIQRSKQCKGHLRLQRSLQARLVPAHSRRCIARMDRTVGVDVSG